MSDGQPEAKGFRPGLRTLLLVAVITGLLVGVGAVLVVRNDAEQRSRTIASTQGFSDAAARSADQVLRDSLTLLDLIATSPILTSIDPSQVQAVLDAVDVGTAGFTGGVAWVGPDGMLRAGSGRDPHAAPEDVSDLPEVRQILDHGAKSFVGTAFISPGKSTPSLVLAVPALDSRKRTVGVVMGTLSLERVARHLTGFRFGGNDLIVLDGNDRIVIAGTTQTRLTDVSHDQLVRRLRRSLPSSETGVTDPLGRKDRLVAAARSPEGNWLIMVSRSNSDAFGADRSNLALELGGLALAACCAIAIAWRGARRLDSLQRFSDAASATDRIARERAIRLRLAIARVGTASSRLELAQIAVGAGREALGAQVAALVLKEDDNSNVFRLIADHGYRRDVGSEREDRYSVTDATAAGATVAMGRPIFLTTPAMAEAFPETASDYDVAGCNSWATLPLQAEGEVFGAITLGYSQDGALSPDRQLEATSYASEVARALAQVRAREVEHEFALTLQRGLLPGAVPDNAEIRVEARYLPSNGVLDVGGDWYDVVQRPDGATMVVVGDVVGHGVPAIAAMGQLSSVCRAVADDASPAEVIGYLDRLAHRVTTAEGTTAVCVLIEPDRSAACYSIAGHPRPLLIENGQVMELDGAISTPLAYGESQHTEARVSLNRPSTLVLFTDGLIERRDAAYGDRLALLRRLATHVPAEELCDTIIAEMAPNDSRFDDTVVVVVHLPL